MGIHVHVSSDPISVQSILDKVASDRAGGTAVFVGTVRTTSEGMDKVTSMDVEAADDLAEKDIAVIAQETGAKYDVEEIAVAHRTGHLRVGEIIVVVAVSAQHRGDAFRACEEVLERLKKTTPIWKKEHSEERSRWVGSEE